MKKQYKKLVLVITDGIGYSKETKYNSFFNAKKPNYDYLFKNVPYSYIKTYGLDVGLPKGQMGNSEVGHLTIGSGRLMYQDLVKISLSIKNNTLEKNKELNNLLNKSNNFHLIGLLSDGGVHSHIDHTIALARIALKRGKKVYIHIITDGRDTPPKSSLIYIKKLKDELKDQIIIASISGRFFAMDRDNRWDRIKKAYEVLFAKNNIKMSVEDYIKSRYELGESDEFISPVSFNDFVGLKQGDSVLISNFRNDRVRQIAFALEGNDFTKFEKENISINITTMTTYDKNLRVPVLFEKDKPKNTLCELISKEGLSQFHTAETEKYAHITFFINGGEEEPLLNETRVLIPSPSVKTYDLMPEMSAKEVTKSVLLAMNMSYDFIVVNFANGDMVGHTGNYDASIKAVEVVDEQLGEVIKKAKEKDYSLLITSDHGNCEQMKDKKGNILTNHTVGDVWCFVIDKDTKKIKNGALNNIAPTILDIMGINIPIEMDKSLKE